MSEVINALEMNEVDIYDNMIKKIDIIKEKMLCLKNYSNNEYNKSVNYIEKLKDFSNEITTTESIVQDMYDEYILQLTPDKLNNLDKNRLKNLIIEKKIQDTFIPYMLYLRVLLQNT